MTQAQVVAGYFRVSLARDNMHAPELYEDEITRYCNYKKLELTKIYSDIDYSAFRGAKPRPSLEQLISERKQYAAIIVPKLSRFGRSMKDLIRLFEAFDADGIPLVFLDMNLDTSTSQGRLLRHILAAFAEYESDVKADYTRANHRRVRAEGRPWGVPPFGYIRGPEPHTWAPERSSASVVRGIFDDYRAGKSANAIAHSLNDRGVQTPRGREWKGQAIGKLLDNAAYAGLSVLDDELVPAQWEPLVERDTWEAVRRRRETDPRRWGNLGKPRPRNPYLLSGLMWCGLCGRKMTHTTTTRDKKGVYHCSGDVWGNWTGCLDMRIHGDLAENNVAERFLERCAFTILTESGARGGSPRTLWREASLPERQRLLGLVIDRVVATPGSAIPRSEYRKRLRHELRIGWKAELAHCEEVVVVADPRAATERREVSDGRHQMLRRQEYACSRDRVDVEAGAVTWAEWRRKRLLPS